MSPANRWSDSTLIKVIAILVTLILFGVGVFAGQRTLSGRVTQAEGRVHALESSTMYIEQEITEIKVDMKEQGIKLDEVKDIVIRMDAKIE